MPDLRVYHTHDGMTVADSIANKFMCERYKISVETIDIQRRSTSASSSTSSSSPPYSSSSLPSSSILLPTTPQYSSVTPSIPNTGADSTATVCVVLMTPSMLRYLDGLSHDERCSLTHRLASEAKLVSVSCFVSGEEAKRQIDVTFSDSVLTWRHLEAGESRDTFHRCMIGLISLLEEEQESTPVPVLKKCRLLPDKPVMAGDTMFLLLENDVTGVTDLSALRVKFEDGTEVSAGHISPSLYQLEVPRCPHSSIALEILTNSGEHLGRETIKYRDKSQLLVSVLLDILNPIEFMCQVLRLDDTSPEMLDTELSDWFKFDDGRSQRTDAQKLMTQWMDTLQCDQASTASSYRELPTLLHLAAKYNLRALAQSLITHPWAAFALCVQNKDGHTPDQLAAQYNHQWLSDFLAAEKEVGQSNSSFEENDELYMSPDYCSPEDIIEQPSLPGQTIYLDLTRELMSERKISTASSFWPSSNSDPTLEGKRSLSRSCPSVYNAKMTPPHSRNAAYTFHLRQPRGMTVPGCDPLPTTLIGPMGSSPRSNSKPSPLSKEFSSTSCIWVPVEEGQRNWSPDEADLLASIHHRSDSSCSDANSMEVSVEEINVPDYEELTPTQRTPPPLPPRSTEAATETSRSSLPTNTYYVPRPATPPSPVKFVGTLQSHVTEMDESVDQDNEVIYETLPPLLSRPNSCSSSSSLSPPCLPPRTSRIGTNGGHSPNSPPPQTYFNGNNAKSSNPSSPSLSRDTSNEWPEPLEDPPSLPPRPHGDNSVLNPRRPSLPPRPTTAPHPCMSRRSNSGDSRAGNLPLPLCMSMKSSGPESKFLKERPNRSLSYEPKVTANPKLTKARRMGVWSINPPRVPVTCLHPQPPHVCSQETQKSMFIRSMSVPAQINDSPSERQTIAFLSPDSKQHFLPSPPLFTTFGYGEVPSSARSATDTSPKEDQLFLPSYPRILEDLSGERTHDLPPDYSHAVGVFPPQRSHRRCVSDSEQPNPLSEQEEPVYEELDDYCKRMSDVQETFDSEELSAGSSEPLFKEELMENDLMDLSEFPLERTNTFSSSSTSSSSLSSSSSLASPTSSPQITPPLPHRPKSPVQSSSILSSLSSRFHFTKAKVNRRKHSRSNLLMT